MSTGAATGSRGIVLLAHGSRDPLWRQPVEAVALRLRQQRPEVRVRCAYLELSAPDLAAATAELVALGVRRVGITPVFVGAGRHARADLPRRVEALRKRHPEVDFRLQPIIGEHPALVELVAQIALAALQEINA